MTSTDSQSERTNDSSKSDSSLVAANAKNRKLANIKRVSSTGSVVLNIQDEAPVRDSSHFVSTFAAGVGSGILSGIICAPLDLVRTRLQAQGGVEGGMSSSPVQAMRDILLREGWIGLFRGLGVTLVTVPLFWGVYFPLYEETKYQFSQRYPNMHPSVVHCSSAVLTGAIADVTCNPLFVVRVRLQTQAMHQLANEQLLLKAQPGMVQTAKDLLHAHGPLVFWRGMAANLMGLSHVAIQFPIYEFLKKTARDRRNDNKPETAMELLLASGLAKMCASLISYPHEVIRSRMMDSRATVAPSVTSTMSAIWRMEGYQGFYTGLPVTLLRVIPNTCVTFISYEFLARWTREHYVHWRRQQATS